MEKLVYLAGPAPGDSIPAFADRVLSDLAPRLCSLPLLAVTVYLVATDVQPQPPLARRNDTGLLTASISLWISSADERGPAEALIADLNGPVAGYVVAESTVKDLPLDQRPGAPSDGLAILAAFAKAPGLSEQAFFAGWEAHSRMSLTVHPLVRYLRNAVVRPLTAGAPEWLGLVTERVASDDDLLDPSRFFGDESHRDQVTNHLTAFADVETFQMEFVREYVFRSEPWRPHLEGGHHG